MPNSAPSRTMNVVVASIFGLLTLIALAFPGGWKVLAVLPALIALGAVMNARGSKKAPQAPAPESVSPAASPQLVSPAPSRAGTWDLPGQKGRFSQEVVGESFHAAAFASILKGVRVTPKGVELIVTASLVPEPHNKYDRHAVAVVVRGQTVGHLPKEDAAVYQPTILAAVKAGRDPQVAARVYSRRDGSIPGGRLNSVRVDLAPIAVIKAG
jgi:hypothetical protein